MGWASRLNPVRAVRNVANAIPQVVSQAFPMMVPISKDFLDNNLGLDPSLDRGAFDPMGGKEAKDMAREEAELARSTEAARQAKIRGAMGQIDTAFSRFDDSYYDGLAKAYVDYYMPQVQEQYLSARRSLATGAPNTTSSSFARTAGDLERDYQRELVGIKDRATTAATGHRAKVEANKGSLKQIALGGEGLEDLAGQAVQAASLASKPPEYSALGDLFGRYATMYANNRIAQSRGYGGVESPLLFRGSSRNTVTNVR